MEANESADGGTVGMDHPRVMASLQATIDAVLMARQHVPLGVALKRAKTRAHELFGDAISQDTVAVRVCVAYAEAGAKP